MKPKAFWLYALFAFCAMIPLAAIAGGLYWYGGGRQTAEYRAYLAQVEARDDWYAERKIDPNQLRFDEVLAGRVPATSIEDPSLRKLAVDLRALALGETDVSSRAKSISAMFVDAGGGLGIRQWISCKKVDGNWKVSECRMRPTVVSLGNPERLAALLGNDEAAKLAALPVVPTELRERPVWSGAAQKRWPWREYVQGIPSFWLVLVSWIAGSFLFAAAFFLLGYAKHRNEAGWRGDRAAEYPDPFKAFPHFVLGWIVYVAMLPGVLLMHALRAVTTDATPAIGRLKDRFVGRTFASEYERILAQLEELEAKAGGLRNSDETLRLIREAKAKVGETKNLADLDKLRSVAESILLHLEIQQELRETLSETP